MTTRYVLRSCLALALGALTCGCGPSMLGPVSADAGDAGRVGSADASRCPTGRTCSADGTTVVACNPDGTPGSAVIESCPATAGETCVAGHCANACDAALTTVSNQGCEFWPVHLWNTGDEAGAWAGTGDFGVVAANTSGTSATVTLEDVFGVIETRTIPSGQAYSFIVTNGRDRLSRTEFGPSFHLRSTAPIAAYQFNPINYSQYMAGGASLLLPTHTLSTRYFVASYTYNMSISTTPPQGQGLLAVVGTRQGTHVRVTVPVQTLGSIDGTVPQLYAGGGFDVVLDAGQTLEIAQANSMEDITGAEITADAPVAAFGGSGATTVPDSATGGDPFEAQLYPTSTWGKTFECEKFQPRGSLDVDHWRVIASEDGTTLTFKPAVATAPTLAAGQAFELSSAQSFELAASKPIQVAHYLEAWGALGMVEDDPTVFPNPLCASGLAGDSRCIGDANMMLAVPVEQYLDQYIFYVPETYAYDFVDVVAPAGTIPKLDGAAIAAGSAIGGGSYDLTRVALKAGYHTISAPNPFGLSVYGFNYAVSYSYAGGLQLRPLQ